MGCLRIFLAMMVVFSHTPYDINWLIDGASAVKVFFVISGFYMFLILDKDYPGPARFYLNRVLKIWPPYIVAALATLLVWHLYIPNLIHAFFTEYGPPVQTYLVATQATLIGHDSTAYLVSLGGDDLTFTWHMTRYRHLLGALTLVQQAWSVSFELYFYLLAPWLARLSTRTLVLMAALAFAARWWVLVVMGVQTDVLALRFFPFEFGIFLLGALGYRAYKAGWHAKVPPAAAFPLLALCLMFACLLVPTGEPRWTLHIISAALAIPTLFHLTRRIQWDTWLGNFSYPVYLVHNIPVFYIAGRGLWPDDIMAQTWFILAWTVPLALLLHYGVVYPLESLRDRVRNARQPSRRSAASSGQAA